MSYITPDYSAVPFYEGTADAPWIVVVAVVVIIIFVACHCNPDFGREG